MDSRFVVELVRFLPQGFISRGWGFIARRKRPRPLIHWLKKTFIKLNGLNMQEALRPIESYQTLEDLFIRQLKPGIHQICEKEQALVSPVDATLGACGLIESGTLLQVKGRNYGLARLLQDAEMARRIDGGNYMTFYLSPKDYHRIHCPVAGHIVQSQVICGRLFPVFPKAVATIDELFARNERLITYIKAVNHGLVAVVKVGATLVGRITTMYDPTLRTNRGSKNIKTTRYTPPIPINRGAELASFELGSTIVLLSEKNLFTQRVFAAGQKIRMGTEIGQIENA